MLVLALWAAALPETLQPVYDLAQTAAPELGARALLRLARTTEPLDKALRKRLIEESLEKAALARMPFPMTMPGGEFGPSVEQLRMLASMSGLNRLALQGEGIRALMAIDAPAARRWFEQLSYPELKGLECTDALAPNPAEYYRTAALVYQSAFTKEEQAKERDLDLMLVTLGRVRSPLELPAAVSLLNWVKWRPGHREIALGRLIAAMDSMNADDRSFTVSAEGLRRSLQYVKEAALNDPFKRYLMRHLQSARCEMTASQDPVEGVWREAGVDPKDAKSTKTLEGKPALRMFNEKTLSGLRKLARELREDPERGSSGWFNRMESLLERIEREKQEWSSTPLLANLFEATAWGCVVSALPQGKDSERVLMRMASFLRQDPLYREDPEAWMMGLQNLDGGITMGNPYLQARWRAELERSGHPGLALWALQERLVPGAPEVN